MIHSLFRLETPINHPNIVDGWHVKLIVALKVHRILPTLISFFLIKFVAMNSSSISKDPRICDDYLQFQNHLKELRKLDDLIIQTLNTTVLTATFRSQGSDASKQCQKLGDEVFLFKSRIYSIEN